MKSFPKILTIFFLTVFILQMIFVFFLLAAPVASQAIEFKPQVGIPGAEKDFAPGGSYKFDPNDSTAPIAKYIRAIYNYAIGIIGILAAVVLMVGGVLWIVAGGNATQIGEAKAYIGAALTGLVLALTSYLILSTVNPALVNLQITKIPGVAEQVNGSCTYRNSPETSICEIVLSEEACDKKAGNFIKGGVCPAVSCCAWNYVGSGRRSCDDKANFSPTYCEKTLNGKYTEYGICKQELSGGYFCEVKADPNPTPCCLYNFYTSFSNNYWKDCIAKINLSLDDCKKLNTSPVTPSYMPNGECQSIGSGYKCATK
ncbi:MAG: hypothetical protein UU95_C0002G0029 [Parcubacteria group bacterium GW2011_GWC2_42_12]|nr:MAG: hypothetical protein UU95_C0002G0029 [Parcubacteria group bacterium GW2011_GWC2_42_12]